MRTIAIICLSVLLFSCVNKDEEIYQLNRRIVRLEQRIDSLIGSRSTNSPGLNNADSPNINPTDRESAFCQAITKRGTQCKRKARNNTYCWQHGK